VVIGTPVVRVLGARMRENRHGHLRGSEPGAVDVIRLLTNRVKGRADRWPEALALNHHDSRIENPHDLAKVALAVPLHRGSRLAALRPGGGIRGAQQVVDESKGIEDVNPPAPDHHEFRVVVGAQRDAVEKAQDVGRATHVRIPGLEAVTSLEPVDKGGTHEHVMPRMATDARRPLSVLLANDYDPDWLGVKLQVIEAPDMVKLSLVKPPVMRRPAFVVVRAYEIRTQDVGGQIPFELSHPSPGLRLVARYRHRAV
jgi:hypothetical protein